MLQDTCEIVYDKVKNQDDSVNKVRFMERLEKLGILPDDPRISELQESLRHRENNIDRERFFDCISKNIAVIENAVSNSNVIDNFESFANDIREIYSSCKLNVDGNLSDFIPQLKKQNPDHFGLSICTIDGQRLQIGDSNVEFCLQSCSKPINYCLALEEHGVNTVHKHVGREPSGVVFNALKLNRLGLPHNPLINSGAIMVCSLIKNYLDSDNRFEYVTNMWEKLTGGKPLGFSNSVYLSERMSGDRNFALAYFMKEKKAYPPQVDLLDTLEFYFQCCSLTITAEKLSTVAATLANGGICPLTGEQVISAENVKSCLSMMYSCGMYDYSGEFAFKIGLPAKSCVAGGIFLVIPNVMGICTFSPLLDKYGNSARGVEFFSKLTQKFNFHLFDNIKMTSRIKENPRNIDHEEARGDKIIECASLGDVGALKRLHIQREDMFKVNYDKRTALHLASSNGHLNVVKYLISKGALNNINAVDRWKNTPYDDAVRCFHYEVSSYLQSEGGKSGSEL